MQNAKILIVEDERITALAIKQKLERLGYVVLATESCGIDAIKKAGELEPDLILMDIILKGKIDGIQTANKINQQFNIPIIYLTAHFEDDIIERAKLTKHYGYIVKPFSDGDLKSSIEIALHKSQIDEKLLESEDKYRKIVETANEGICSVDLTGTINFINPRMAEMLGYNVEEMDGVHISKFIDKKLLKRTGKILKNPTEVLKRQHAFEFVRKDGSKIQTIIETSTINNEEGNNSGLLAMVTDIKDRINAEKEIKRANIYHRGLIESSLDPLVTISPDGTIYDVNNATERVTGYSRNELIGTEFFKYFKDPEKAQNGFQKVLAEGKVKNYELEIKNKEGKITPVSYNASIYKDEKGEVIGVFAAARDITEIKKAEKNIKSSLKEKEVLLREIHHRVKNNLQIISSLLSLQSGYINDNEALDVFKESQNRVKSMAMIHEMLYKSDCLMKINFREYINELTNNLIYNYKISPNTVQIEQNIDNIYFDINTSIHCGLIVNELVSNSLKHAFPPFKTSELLKESFISSQIDYDKINIELKEDEDNYIITIADNGIGFPDNIDFRKTDSLGLELVNNLVGQIDGTIELDKTLGTKFTVVFKLENYDAVI